MSRFLAAVLVLTLAACNGTSFSDFGTLVLRTETLGDDLDPDGYTIRLDGQAPRAIGITDSLVLQDVASGEHSVELRGLAENCRTTGENPLPILTQAAIRTEVTIQVTCVASTAARRQHHVTARLEGAPPFHDTLILIDECQLIPVEGVELLIPADFLQIGIRAVTRQIQPKDASVLRVRGRLTEELDHPSVECRDIVGLTSHQELPLLIRIVHLLSHNSLLVSIQVPDSRGGARVATSSAI